MTSLEFFPEHDAAPIEVPEWGTLEEKSKKKPEDLWLPKRATWTFSGEPTGQKYTLTKLRLSDNRMTDQLLPRPQDSTMADLMIRQPFPAEHPYSSHMPKFDVFPSFAKVPGDPKRGVEARNIRPKPTEMPANSYDINVIKKIKGFGVRHELQALPPESEKDPLVWHDHNFDQTLKLPYGNQQNYYPVPPKQYVPNLEVRDNAKCIRGDMVTSKRHDNAARNVERDQWETTYDRAHTGLGPANPNALDNYDEKIQKLSVGIDDDKLKPRSKPTFDPAQPFEGRIARNRTPNPPKHTHQYPDPPRNMDYKRQPTLTEREEERLLNGKPYVSLPGEDPQRGQHTEGKQNPEVGLHMLSEARSGQPMEAPPYTPAGPPPEPDVSHLIEMRREQHDRHQQVEAEARWKELELQTPGHNLTARQHKIDMASKKTQPKVFYDHESRYQRERSGMYKTSYDPYKLQGVMNAEEKAGARLMDYSDYTKNSLDYPTDLNDDMAEAIRYNRTLGGPPGSVPQLHSQPSQHETFTPFDKQKQRQKSLIQPDVRHSDVRTQEGGVVLMESTQGENYNTHKYLQENTLHPHARQEPLGLMSSQNQDLKRISTLETARSEPDVSGMMTHQYQPVHNPTVVEQLPARASYDPYGSLPVDIRPTISHPAPTASRNNPAARRAANGGGALQKSKSSNYLPTDMRHSWSYQTSYQSHHAGDEPIDMGYKHDSRFNWRVGSGTPRPQSTLLQIQDSFNKSETKKKFYSHFGDNAPDLRENLVYGKKHNFAGFNAQVMRGTPVIQC